MKAVCCEYMKGQFADQKTGKSVEYENIVLTFPETNPVKINNIVFGTKLYTSKIKIKVWNELVGNKDLYITSREDCLKLKDKDIFIAYDQSGNPSLIQVK